MENKNQKSIKINKILLSFLTIGIGVDHGYASAEQDTTKEKTTVKETRLNVDNIDSKELDEQWKEGENAILPFTVSDLPSALSAAYQNNQELQQRRREILATNQDLAKAYASFFPTLDASTGISGNNQRFRNDPAINASVPISQRTHTLNAQLTLKQNLFAGGATLAAISAADQSMRSGWAQLMSYEQQTFTKVITAYVDLVTKKSKVDARKAYRAAMQKNYEQSFEKNKVGEETVTQVANAESKLMDADAELRSAEADVVGAEAEFFAQTGAPAKNLNTPVTPNGLPKELEKAINIALQNHPDIVAAKFSHLAAKSEIDKANAQLYSPSIDANASSTRNSTNTRNIGNYDSQSGVISNGYQVWNRNTNNQVGVTMSYQLYSGGLYSSNKRKAHDAALSKRFAIEAAKQKIISDIKSAFEKFLASQTNIEFYKKKVKATEIAVASNKQELDVGTKVLKDVLDAESDHINAKLNLIDAENTYLKAAYKLVELLGALHAKALKLDVPYFDPKAHADKMPIGY